MIDERGAVNNPTPVAGRPNVPNDYGIADVTAGELLPWSWAVERLEASRNYWVATVRPDGRPHVMPVWGVWHNGAFFFGTDPNSRKARNLQANPRTVVNLESGDEVVALEGVMVEVTEMDDLHRMGDALSAKYGFQMDMAEMGAAAFRMAPQVAFGWTEANFPQNATRWVFGDTKTA